MQFTPPELTDFDREGLGEGKVKAAVVRMAVEKRPKPSTHFEANFAHD